MEISVENLFNMLQQERKTGEVLPLPKTFYKDAERESQNLEKQSADSQHPGNFRKLLATIKERRTQKLLIYLAYNKQLPNQMPDEEEQLYKSIRLLLDGNSNFEQKLRKVKMLEEIPELQMPNGKLAGPYKQNQIIELADNYEVEYLLSNKLGEQI